MRNAPMGKTKGIGASIAALLPVSSRHGTGGLPAVESVDACDSSLVGLLTTAAWRQRG
jgi:hypothetical protein